MARSEDQKYTIDEVSAEISKVARTQLIDPHNAFHLRSEFAQIDEILESPDNTLIQKIAPFRSSLFANLPPNAIRHVVKVIEGSPFAFTTEGQFLLGHLDGRLQEKAELFDLMKDSVLRFNHITDKHFGAKQYPQSE